jgi:hypothetical protein
MDLRDLVRADKRSGTDRRKYRDPGYAGRERRSGADRRSVMFGMRPAGAEASAVSCVIPGAGTGPFAHCLQAPNGQRFHSPLVVVKRLSCEFAYVEADEAEGYRHVLEMLEWLEAKIGGRSNSIHNERVRHLGAVKDRAIHVLFGDDLTSENAYLCSVIVPGEPLVFEHASSMHERAIRPLLKRCAKVLGYEIVKVAAEDFISSLSLRPQH